LELFLFDKITTLNIREDPNEHPDQLRDQPYDHVECVIHGKFNIGLRLSYGFTKLICTLCFVFGAVPHAELVRSLPIVDDRLTIMDAFA
jgi:hypothetical protein